jgi:PAS domain S-box-containing protein
MDRDGRFTIASDAFVSLIGADNAAVLGQPWIDVARKLGLDPDEQISHAIDSRETWSGIAISWPIGGSEERLTVDMSGLPMFDRERTFLGYRGFGVCRDAERFAARLHAAAAPLQETAASEVETDVPTLSAGESNAFRELARQLNARLKGDRTEGTNGDGSAAQDRDVQATGPEPELPPTRDGVSELMERLPVGVLVYRHDMPIYANRAFLKWSGDASLEAFTASGGIDRLFLESDVTGGHDGAGKKLTLTTGDGTGLAECRLFSIMWDGERAHALAIVPAQSALRAEDADLQQERRRTGELRSIIDISADGVVVFDGEGVIVRLNRGAESLFGRETEAVEGRAFVELLAPEHREAASADFAMLVETGVQRPGREVAGGAGEPGKVLFMTVGHVSADKPTYCAVFRDITQWKRAEQDLIAAKRQAEQASRQKSDFLAKISHEIRTPLNAIIGFSEVMMEERLGPVDNERYRAYLKDIHASGAHVVSLLNDLLDLSKIEAGKLELSFADVDLNELTQHCVALMQPQANTARVIIRTSLAPTLPQIVADARSVRQILLNLLSNSIKFTAAGGQVIVSTALTEGNEAVLRVRDTGIGMSEKEIETALEPFRQIETSARGGSGGTGLGLPLTKALAEANRANFAIKSNINAGTLVEVAFPTTQTRHG